MINAIENPLEDHVDRARRRVVFGLTTAAALVGSGRLSADAAPPPVSLPRPSTDLNNQESKRILQQAEAAGVSKGVIAPLERVGGAHPLDLAEVMIEALGSGSDNQSTQNLLALTGSLLAQQTQGQREGNQSAPGEPLSAAPPPSFNQLKLDYRTMFQIASVKGRTPRRLRNGETDFRPEVDKAARIMVARVPSDQYKSVSAVTGIPWYVIGALHYRETNFNFLSHLHNGDPLMSKTFHVPAGRPNGRWPAVNKDGSEIVDPLTIWRLSAGDALHAYGNVNKWTVERMCYFFEAYNGFGYRNHNTSSPYLWNYTDFYNNPPKHSAGGFPKDGLWSASYISRQIGTIALILAVSSLLPDGVNFEFE